MTTPNISMPDPKKDFYNKTKEIVDSSMDDLTLGAVGPLGGRISYFGTESYIATIRNYFSYITLEGLYQMQDPRFERLQKLTEQFFSLINKIQTTRLTNSHETSSVVENVVTSFKNAYNDETLEKIWGLILESRTMLSINTERKPLSDKEHELDIALGKVKQGEIAVQKIVDTMRDEIAKAGVGKHAILFKTQAETHAREAGTWKKYIMILLGVNAVLIITLLSIILYGRLAPLERFQIAALAIGLISLVSYALVLCVKSYFAEKHNQSINEHRSNSLGTFNTFANSATGEDEKTAILLQATNTIFSFQKSGFLRKDSESLNPNPAIEIFKKLIDKTSGK